MILLAGGLNVTTTTEKKQLQKNRDYVITMMYLKTSMKAGAIVVALAASSATGFVVPRFGGRHLLSSSSSPNHRVLSLSDTNTPTVEQV